MSRTSPGSTATARHSPLLLPIIGLALMMVVAAVAGLNVALPSLARDTNATQTQLQWIVDAYTVVFSGLLLSAGALGDRYGRKGFLLAGIAIFGAAAAGAMSTNNPTLLIGLRALMGVGAAGVMPATLSIISTSFPEEERPRAVGVWVGIAGGGAVLGLLGSGVLLEYFSWNSFFALNVLLAVAAFAGTLAIVPNSRDIDPPPFDGPGSLFSLLTVSGLVFGIIEGPERGWADPLTVTALLIGLGALIGFVVWERRSDAPMLDVRLFRLRGFGTGSLSLTTQFFASFGFFFVILQYFQYVAGFSPLKAAIALLPMPAVLIPLARQAPVIAAKFGLNRVGAAGLALLAAGLMVISRVDVDLVYWQFLVGLVLFSAGMALAGTPSTTAVIASLPPSKQGVASAVNDTAREFGSALGIAVLGSVLNAQYRAGLADAVAGLPPAIAHGARQSIAFVQSDAVGRLGPAGTELVETARRSFVDGVATATLLASGVVLVVAIVVALRGPGRIVKERDGIGAAHELAMSPALADAVLQRSPAPDGSA